MEGWGTTESLSNPVLHNRSILSTGKLRPGSQGQPEAGLEPWHRAMTGEAVFFRLLPWAWNQRLGLGG